MKREIRKLLVANRGEIASRIFRTCRSMGIATVAVFSDADASLPFVRHAEEAYRLGPGPSRDSYLRIDRILEAARATGADAIHPGFGFLAENDGFAQAVLDAGLVWVGPTPAAIRAMGLKREAKITAAAAGVPILPGYSGEEQSLEAFERAARDIGFPLLLKASAGGGGKGMRIVRAPRELREAYESARREAEAAFGNPTLIAERYVEKPRHIEIQILGDEHGHLVHFGERECSIQRRHQKILEEAPSVALDPTIRKRMGEAAVALARSIGYTSAGTVEMLLAPSGEFFFLEVNTRLQVEHPVTEGIYDGLDLVEEQIRIARGERLRWSQTRIDEARSGWSMEARLCAEDPANDFLPQSGVLRDFHLPAELAKEAWLRIESTVESGSEVSIHYDSMIAKLVVRGRDRTEAIARLRRVLASLSVQGIRTNRGFLLALVDHPAFARGELHTHFIEEHLAGASSAQPTDFEVARAAAIATLTLDALRAAQMTILPALPRGFRNNPSLPERSRYRHDRTELTVSLERRRGTDAVTLTVGDRAWSARLVDLVPELQGPIACGFVSVDLDTHRIRARYVATDRIVDVLVPPASVTLERLPRFPSSDATSVADGCVAPMPGKILRVFAEPGSTVDAGATLVVMEAMKMEHVIKAPRAAKIAEVRVQPGDQVDAGTLLAVLASD